MAGIDKRFPAIEGHNESIERMKSPIVQTLGELAVAQGTLVPYSGTESEQDIPTIVHVQEGTMRADLPA